MKSKKASDLMVGVLVAIVVAVVLLGVMKVISDNSGDLADDALCKTALYSSQITQDSLLLNCKTNIITIDQEMLNKINVDKYIKLHKGLDKVYFNSDPVNGDINTNEFKINKVISDEMADLWSIVGEGGIKPFNRFTKDFFNMGNSVLKYCYIRSYIRFKPLEGRDIMNSGFLDYSIDETSSPSKNSLVYFMTYNPVSPNNDQSYYNYLKDEDSMIANYVNVVFPMIEDDRISQDEEYYIIYRKTYVNNDLPNSAQLIGGIAGIVFSNLFNNEIVRTSLKLGGAILAGGAVVDRLENRIDNPGVDEIILIDTKTFDEKINEVASDEILCNYYIN